MYRIDNATAITPIPAPAAVGPNPNYFFTKGNPALGIPATIVDDDWANALQEEIANCIEGVGVTLDKTKRNQLFTALQGKLGRIRLLGNANFYVRSDGSDANNGLANTAGGAFLTLAHAAAYIESVYDANGFTITINVQAGTFAGGSFSGSVPGLLSPLLINGVGASTIFNTGIGANSGGIVRVQNFNIGVTVGSALSANLGGQLYVGAGINVTGAQGGSNGIFGASINGLLQVEQNIIVSGGAGYIFQAVNGGIIFSDSRTFTLTGTPAFNQAIAGASLCGQIAVTAATFTGGATGTRYVASTNGVINTNGGGANYFPGSVAGSTSTGGQYA